MYRYRDIIATVSLKNVGTRCRTCHMTSSLQVKFESELNMKSTLCGEGKGHGGILTVQVQQVLFVANFGHVSWRYGVRRENWATQAGGSQVIGA